MPGPFSQRRSDLFQVHQPRIWRLGSAAVILAVIPPGITRKTGSDQTDGPADLTSKDVTRWYPMDGAEATHNRSVAGSRPASPTEQDNRPSFGRRLVGTPGHWNDYGSGGWGGLTLSRRTPSAQGRTIPAA